MLGWGNNADLPEGVTRAWGARLIAPADLLPDRQDWMGENEGELEAWLNGGALKQALERSRELFRENFWGQHSDNTQTLYEDDQGVIKGNPHASYGYVYLAAWLRKDVPA